MKINGTPYRTIWQDAGGVVEAAIEKYHFTYSYGLNSVHIDNIHIAEPFQLVSDSGFIQWLDYGVPLGANSNMNEGDCFN